jgi:ABC-type multidrug transport system permease subunit
MQFLLSSAEKDLRRHARDPLALVIWVGIPLLIGGLIATVMGGMDKAPPVPFLLVADEDGGRVSWLLSRAFGQAETGKFLRVEEVQREEGRARIDQGDASALLVIPAGFIEAVLREKPTTLLLVTNPSQHVLPQMVEESLGMLSDGVFYVHRLAGPELRAMVQGPPPGQRMLTDQEVARLSMAMNKVAERLGKYLFPPVIEVEAKLEDQPDAPKVSITQLFLPGILIMALVFMAEGLSGDWWRERDQGTLRRAACTPASTMALLGGKMLAAASLMLGCSIIILVVGMLYLGITLTKLPLLVTWSVFSGLLFLLLLQFLQLHLSSQRAASVLTNSIAMPLLFVGGSFFPFEVMPAWMATIGRWTPNGWVLAHVKDILAGRESAGSFGAAFAGTLLVGVVMYLLCERRLRAFARG